MADQSTVRKKQQYKYRAYPLTTVERTALGKLARYPLLAPKQRWKLVRDVSSNDNFLDVARALSGMQASRRAHFTVKELKRTGIL